MIACCNTCWNIPCCCCRTCPTCHGTGTIAAPWRPYPYWYPPRPYMTYGGTARDHTAAARG